MAARREGAGRREAARREAAGRREAGRREAAAGREAAARRARRRQRGERGGGGAPCNRRGDADCCGGDALLGRLRLGLRILPRRPRLRLCILYLRRRRRRRLCPHRSRLCPRGRGRSFHPRCRSGDGAGGRLGGDGCRGSAVGDLCRRVRRRPRQPARDTADLRGIVPDVSRTCPGRGSQRAAAPTGPRADGSGPLRLYSYSSCFACDPGRRGWWAGAGPRAVERSGSGGSRAAAGERGKGRGWGCGARLGQLPPSLPPPITARSVSRIHPASTLAAGQGGKG